MVLACWRITGVTETDGNENWRDRPRHRQPNSRGTLPHIMARKLENYYILGLSQPPKVKSHVKRHVPHAWRKRAAESLNGLHDSSPVEPYNSTSWQQKCRNRGLRSLMTLSSLRHQLLQLLCPLLKIMEFGPLR